MRFWSVIVLRASALLLLLGLALSGCVVVEEEGYGGPGYGGGPRPGGGYCTREYDPVCGRRGGDQQTFANACLADDSGYRVVRRGECRRDDGGGGGNGPRACSRQYDPVCGQRGNDRRTFSNSCQADEAGYDVVRRGECRRDYSEPTPQPPRPEPTDVGCSREYRPVCARRGGSDARTFPNECEARTAGYGVIGEGECRAEPDRQTFDGRPRRQPGQ